MEKRFVTSIDPNNGFVFSEEYRASFNRGSVTHRNPKEGPAFVSYRHNGEPELIEYYWHGRLHRKDGPAHVLYGEDGRIVEEHYYRHGVLHRDPKEGPAWIERCSPTDPTVVTEEHYMFHDGSFRDPADGPHSTEREDDGSIRDESYLTAEQALKIRRPSAAWRRSRTCIAQVVPT
jgi:hypothetical protein